MQLSGRPLLDNLHDHALFVGRDDVLQKIGRGLGSGLNCLVFGDPGSGKTSLVRALMFRMDRGRTDLDDAPDRPDDSNRFDFFYVRANEARGAADLLTSVLDVLQPISAERRATSKSPIALLDELVKVVADLGDREDVDLDSGQQSNVGEGSGSRGGDARTRVIVVEDVSAVAGAEVFGALRDEVWQVDALWLVTTSTAQVAGLLRPPADVFFETRVELAPLTTDDAQELLGRRLDDPLTEASMEVISIAAESAGGLPRRLLEVARELAAEPTVGGARLNTGRGLKARTEALANCSRPARMLAQELEALGWVSASDERLLSRMGWTRPRVVQVMAELESGGLVEMREENTGRGRPRKLYRLVPAADFIDPPGGRGSS